MRSSRSPKNKTMEEKSRFFSLTWKSGGDDKVLIKYQCTRQDIYECLVSQLVNDDIFFEATEKALGKAKELRKLRKEVLK